LRLRSRGASVEGVLLSQPVVQHTHSLACLLKQLLLPLYLMVEVVHQLVEVVHQLVEVVHQLVGGSCLRVG
jgi:hypothetical protein